MTEPTYTNEDWRALVDDPSAVSLDRLTSMTAAALSPDWICGPLECLAPTLSPEYRAISERLANVLHTHGDQANSDAFYRSTTELFRTACSIGETMMQLVDARSNEDAGAERYFACVLKDQYRKIESLTRYFLS